MFVYFSTSSQFSKIFRVYFSQKKKQKKITTSPVGQVLTNCDSGVTIYGITYGNAIYIEVEGLVGMQK